MVIQKFQIIREIIVSHFSQKFKDLYFIEFKYKTHYIFHACILRKYTNRMYSEVIEKGKKDHATKNIWSNFI